MADFPFKPRGLWRTPTETGSPPGSCRTLDNVCIRKQGVWEPLPDFTNTNANGAPGIPLKMFDVPGDDLLVIYDNGGGTIKTSWIDKDDGTETAVTVNGADPTYENGCASLVRYRDRYYLTSKEGLLCFDSAGDATARRAGFPAPKCWIQVASTTTDATGPTGIVGYRAVFERELADGSLIVSAPTPPAKWTSTGSTWNLTPRVEWNAGSVDSAAEVIAGDYVSLYRTDSFDADPIGDTYRLVKRIQLVAGDITNGYLDILDDVPDSELGAELYTNPGQKGLEKAHFPPPYLRDVVLFKGALVGIAYNEAYGVTFRVPGRWGALTTDALRVSGIGQRTITGTTSSGVNTITSVSASHMKGITGIVGQVVSHANFPNGTKITGATGSTITCDQNATASGSPSDILILDRIEIDGTEINANYPGVVEALMTGTDVTAFADSAVSTGSSHDGMSMSVVADRASYAGHTHGVRATNGDHYSPNLPELAETAKAADDSTQGNRLAWSELDQPEHWPLVNRDTVGQGEILRLVVAGDICYIFNDQGEVYAMTGIPDNWRYDLIAEDVQLATVGSVAAHEGRVYAWTNQGLVVFSGGQMLANLTAERLNDDMKAAYYDFAGTGPTRQTWLGEVAVDQFNREVWLITGSEATLGYNEGKPWIYNLQTDEWYRYTANYKAPVYVEDRATMYVGRKPSEAWMISYADEHDSGTKIDSSTIELNRLDLGAPGVLKKWREVVLSFRPLRSGSETFAFFTNGDGETGGATDSTNYSPTLDATDSVNLACYVARNTGMSVTQRIKLTRATHSTAWEIETVTVRFTPLVDRTGARAA